MRFNTLPEWLAWQEGLHTAEIDMGLVRVQRVAERLDLLSPAAKVLTVAGTNGKGSCVATVEAICLDQNVSVGTFTSPHLLRYNERIRLNGVEVSDKLLCESFERIDQARGDTSLTYFEFGPLAAIDIITRAGVELMVLEVGLGGRLDAVNIIDADVAVVTSIAIDHEEWLGSDISVIGHEKAGIYRPHQWAICADEQAPESVADYAHNIGAYWVAMGMSMNVSMQGDEHGEDRAWTWSGVTDDGDLLQLQDLPIPSLPLPSVAAALQAWVLLGNELPTNVATLVAGLHLSGRAEMRSFKGVELLLDVAHNPAAAELLAERLSAQPPHGRTLAVVAMMADKDRMNVLQPLIPHVADWFVAGLPQNSRAATGPQLAENLAALGQQAQVCNEVGEALQAAVDEAGEYDRVLVMGSFFTVAAALQWVQ
ncbi:MAG: bifunctional tetrahydrofolate synthase/dihydrofolate synthase [Cellvibrionaceae bacterium]|nr:bifunctional tetrahydrofolate synthase/dihydrofolate synthase [Cellvibrionaceae bacterium]